MNANPYQQPQPSAPNPQPKARLVPRFRLGISAAPEAGYGILSG